MALLNAAEEGNRLRGVNYFVGRSETRIRPESCGNCLEGVTRLLNG